MCTVVPLRPIMPRVCAWGFGPMAASVDPRIRTHRGVCTRLRDPRSVHAVLRLIVLTLNHDAEVLPGGKRVQIRAPRSPPSVIVVSETSMSSESRISRSVSVTAKTVSELRSDP